MSIPSQTEELSSQLGDLEKQNEKLQAELDKYKTLFQSFPHGITITDSAGNILETNKKAEKILGLKREEHEQRTIDGEQWKIIRTDGTEMPAQEWASVIALKENRTVSDCEMGIAKNNRTTTWMNVSAAPMAVEGLGVVVTYSDITAKVQLEKDLLLAQQRNTTILETIPDMMFVLSKDGEIIDYQASNAEELVLDRDKVSGSNIAASMPQEVAEKIKRATENALKQNQLQIVEYTLPVKKGIEDYEARLMPLNENSVLAIVRNVSELEIFKKTLTEREDMFQKTFHRMHILSSISTIEDGKYIEVNDTFAKTTGHSRQDVIGQTSVNLGIIKKQDRDWLKQEMLRNGFVKNVELELVHADGSPLYFLFSSDVIEVKGEKRLLSTAIDITERKHQEQLLEQQKTELEVHSKKLTDMNTALNVLLGHKSEEKDNYMQGIINSFNKLVLPYCYTPNERKSDEELLTTLSIIEKNIKEILFGGRDQIPSYLAVLTPMEAKVAQMIKEGKNSKEIAHLLRMSIHTVYFHRENIRKKLNITKSGSNLKTFLQTQP